MSAPKSKFVLPSVLIVVMAASVAVWLVGCGSSARVGEPQYSEDVTLHRDVDGAVTIDVQGHDLIFADVGEFTDAIVQLSGSWTVRKAPDAYHGLCAWATASQPTGPNSRGADLSIAYIKPSLPVAGRYDVDVWWCKPKIGGVDKNLEIRVHEKAGEVYQWTYANPRETTGEWQRLGTFYIEPDGEMTVSNWNGAVVLDAIRFVYRDDLRESATPPIPLPPPPFASPTPIE